MMRVLCEQKNFITIYLNKLCWSFFIFFIPCELYAEITEYTCNKLLNFLACYYFLLFLWLSVVLGCFSFSFFSFLFVSVLLFAASGEVIILFYASSSSTKTSGTIWSPDDLLKSRVSSCVIHGCSKISSDRMRSSGSFRNSERIIQRAFDVKQSGTRNWPRDIFANNEACSESLNGYLQIDKKRNIH